MVQHRLNFLQLSEVEIQVLLTTVLTRGRKNPTHWKLPERLRRERKRRQLSAAALSRAAGVGTNTVSQIEAGQRLPRLPVLERIADALKISAGYLAYGQQGEWEAVAELRCEGLPGRLIETRAALGLSLREVDRRAGTRAGTIRSIEAGSKPILDTLESLASALTVSPAWLAFGLGPCNLARRRGGLTRSCLAMPVPDSG